MNELVAAEWLKLRTTRLLYGMIPAAVAISVAAVAGNVIAHEGGVLQTSDGVRDALSLTGTGAILLLVVGITISAGEYRTGTATDTFLTTPRRHRVLAAKLTTGAVLGLATGVVIATAGLGMAAVLYRAENASFPIGSTDVWLTLAGTLVYTTLFAVLGVSLGSLVRNQTLGTVAALTWLAVVEHALANLATDIGRWLPAAAGQAIVRAPLDGLLSPFAGTAVLTAYSAVIALVGIRTAATRDA
jgi:ABC-2 type transport system permease protein